jgi:hypothetical protein
MYVLLILFVGIVMKIIHTNCLALYCYVYLENINFVYPAMSMFVIGPSLLY